MLQSAAEPMPIENRYFAEAQVITHVERALAAEWQALAAAASEPNAFAEPWFVASALSCLAEGETVRLALVRDTSGQLVGAMPLVTQRDYGRISVGHTSNWIHLQCYCGMPLIRAGAESGFWTALLDLLDRSEWSSGLLSMRMLYADGPVMRGLERAAKAAGRQLHVAQQYERAVLASKAAPAEYLETTVRAKKRKELRRQAKRLAELGKVAFERLGPAGPLDAWCDDYLTLEAAGWKGQGGTALAAANDWTRFFRETMASAQALGKLDFYRLSLDGRAIAMLINLRAPPAVWSYKITYDEGLARFSPGVLLELEVIPLLLEDPQLAWADSCAKPDHTMINGLWGERQTMLHVSVSLKGPLRWLNYMLCRSIDGLGTLFRKDGAKNDD